MGSNDKLIINYHDACIYESDLRLLESHTEWLNDSCINYQMRRLERRAAQVQERQNRKQPSGTCTSTCTSTCTDTGTDTGTDIGTYKGIENTSLRYTISGVEYLDPSVVSFFMHQLSIGDEDDREEMLSLCQTWGLDPCKEASSSSLSSPSSPVSSIPMKMVLFPINDNNSASLYSFQTPGGGNHWSLLALLVGEADVDIEIGNDVDVDIDVDSKVHQNQPLVDTTKRQKTNGGGDGHDDNYGNTSCDNNVNSIDTSCFRAYFHFDSARGYNSSTAATVATKIDQMYLLYEQQKQQQRQPQKQPQKQRDQNNITNPTSTVNIIECSVPQQINSYDCGVHTLATADAIGSVGIIDIIFSPTTEVTSLKHAHIHSRLVLDNIKRQFEKAVEDFILGKFRNINEMTKHQRRSIANDIKKMKKEA